MYFSNDYTKNNSSGYVPKFQMKVAVLILLALSGYCLADLGQDFEDFVDIFPLFQMHDIIRRHINTDPQYQQVVTYLKSDQFLNFVDDVAELPEVQDFMKWTESKGLKLPHALQFVYSFFLGEASTIDGSEWTVEMGQGNAQARTLEEMVKELGAIVDPLKMLDFALHKLKTSPDFVEFGMVIVSDESRAVFDQVLAMEEVTNMVNMLSDMGVNVISIIQDLYNLLGWN